MMRHDNKPKVETRAPVSSHHTSAVKRSMHFANGDRERSK